MPKARTRRRNVDVKSDEVPSNIKELVSTVYSENQKSNAHKRKHDKARKDLYSDMKEAKLKTVNFPAVIDGKTKNLEAKITVPDEMLIDMKKLRDLVTEEQWLDMISTTKGAIENIAGTAVANQVITHKPNPDKENVKVSVPK